MAPVVSPIDLSDAAPIALLLADSDGPSSRFLFSILAQPTTHAWKLSSAGQIAAVAWFTVVAGESELLDIRVAATQRGQGFGSTLLRACLAQVFTLADTCLLEVRRSNIGAQRLYQRFGFAETGLRRDYYPCPTGREDAILMRLEGERVRGSE